MIEVIFLLCISPNWILHCVRNLRIVEERMGIIHNPEHPRTYLNKEGIRKNREWKLLENLVIVHARFKVKKQ